MFEIRYQKYSMIMVEEKKTWNQVVEFINFLDEYGLGYVFEIRHKNDENPYYTRQLDHENGSDYWLNHLGKRVDLAKQNWETV